MGRAKHSRDKGRLTQTEHKQLGGGALVGGSAAGAPPARLPFGCCALTFLPCTGPDACPVATRDGSLFDAGAAMPFFRVHGVHPVTGDPARVGDLIPLHFHRGADGALACPALGKALTDSTAVVAVATTGHVYSRDAVQELCVKAKNMVDLVDGTPFARGDIIVLNDPAAPRRAAASFAHVARGLAVPEKEGGGNGDAFGRVDASRVSADARRALGALASSATAAPIPAPADDPRLRAPARPVVPTPVFRPGTTTWATDDGAAAAAAAAATAAPHSSAPHAARRAPRPYDDDPTRTSVDAMRTTGAQSRSFTSTAVAAATDAVNARATARKYVTPPPGTKAYARLATSHGDLSLELHADAAPRAVENFLTLAAAGYYDGVAFHRSIKNFMLQGGDPTETGTGGESIYGAPFPDEIDRRLTHDGRGVVAMANSGPCTNGSQFYITYKSCRHLDGKHTIFGRVVGGGDALTSIEAVPTDGDDRPRDRVEIKGVTVYVDPFEEGRKAEREAKDGKAVKAGPGRGAYAAPRPAGGGTAAAVGRYLRPEGAGAAAAPAPKKARTANPFDAW